MNLQFVAALIGASAGVLSEALVKLILKQRNKVKRLLNELQLTQIVHQAGLISSKESVYTQRIPKR